MSLPDATVHNEFIGSDHSIVQIAIRGSDPPTKTHIPRWNFQSANWKRFSDLCDLSLPSISTELEQSYQLCEASILQAATASIPQTKYSEKLSVPWWNAGCDRAIKNKACFQSHESYKIANWIIFKRCRAIARRTVLAAKETSWRHYCSSITNNAKLAKVWRTLA